MTNWDLAVYYNFYNVGRGLAPAAPKVRFDKHGGSKPPPYDDCGTIYNSPINQNLKNTNFSKENL